MFVTKSEIEQKYSRLAGYEFGKIFPGGIDTKDWNEDAQASLIPSAMGGYLNRFIRDFKLETFPMKWRVYTDEYFRFSRCNIDFSSATFHECYFHKAQFINCDFTCCNITFGNNIWNNNSSEIVSVDRFDSLFVNCDFAGAHINLPDYNNYPDSQKPGFLDCNLEHTVGTDIPCKMVYMSIVSNTEFAQRTNFMR